MKSLFLYPLVILILGGLYAAAVEGFKLDFGKMFENITPEIVTFVLAVSFVCCVVVGDIIRSKYKHKLELAKTYKKELEMRSQEDSELENLRAIVWHQSGN